MGRRWRDGRGRLIVRADSGGGQAAATVPLEIATSYRARTKGLLGRDAVDGALLLSPASGVHTFGMRIPIDVAYLDRRLTVIAVRTMRPGRLGLPRPRARHVLEAEAGAMAGWGLRPGARVEVEADPGC
ncbi:Secreted protein [Streptomyces hygroscopicus subsp. limoneus]|nr:Secreted protein [Streptomyces hygroscopicus subsp. limoneus]